MYHYLSKTTIDKETAMPVVPVVHLTGTSREDLSGMYRDVFNALVAAQEVLAENGPDERDYCPGSFGLAMAEHRDRFDKLQRIMDEIREIRESVNNRVQTPRTPRMRSSWQAISVVHGIQGLDSRK